MAGKSADRLTEKWLAARRRARHDGLFLAREILGYRDVTDVYHGPIFDLLQHFPHPLPHEFEEYEHFEGGEFFYKPLYTLYHSKDEPNIPILPGGRRRLILDPRGTFKTTVNVITHTIQWVLNFPNVSLLIVHAQLSWAERILNLIADHFRTNERLRELFPDYCPHRKNDREFSSREGLWCPRRTRQAPEPTIGVSSIEASITGAHYDVIKFSDIVERENTKTGNQIQTVIESFGFYRNILVRPESWIDIEGTPWDFSDLYSRLIEEETKKPLERREWQTHVRGIYKKRLPPGQKKYFFSPEERDYPDLLDDKGQKVSWMPDRFSVWEMEKERLDPVVGGFVFASQRLVNPVDTGETKPFPIKDARWISPEDFARVPIQYVTLTVDTAETLKEYSDYSTITVGAWDAYGRLYVPEIQHEKMLPDRFIDLLLTAYVRWRPLNIKIEETGYIRGLKPSLLREAALRGIYPNFDFLPRDNQQSKKDRILNSLQPYYKRGELIFLSNLTAREALEKELSRFPTYQRDDILDTLSDQFQNREWFGRLSERPSLQTLVAQNQDVDHYLQMELSRKAQLLQSMMKAEFNKMTGEDKFNHSTGEFESPEVGPFSDPFAKTGGL